MDSDRGLSRSGGSQTASYRAGHDLAGWLMTCYEAASCPGMMVRHSDFMKEVRGGRPAGRATCAMVPPETVEEWVVEWPETRETIEAMLVETFCLDACVVPSSSLSCRADGEVCVDVAVLQACCVMVWYMTKTCRRPMCDAIHAVFRKEFDTPGLSIGNACTWLHLVACYGPVGGTGGLMGRDMIDALKCFVVAKRVSTGGARASAADHTMIRRLCELYDIPCLWDWWFLMGVGENMPTVMRHVGRNRCRLSDKALREAIVYKNDSALWSAGAHTARGPSTPGLCVMLLCLERVGVRDVAWIEMLLREEPWYRVGVQM